MFMKKTSFAACNGINSWIEKCAREGGCLDVAEKERMSIVQQFKDPIDELGRLLQTSERIDQLYVSIQAQKYPITFFEYLFEELFEIGSVGGVAYCFAPRLSLEYAQLRRWEELLQTKRSRRREESHLSSETDCMYRLLQAIRTYQQLDPHPMPDWLSPMPA